ncbi:putative disease resistance RPP13-like protein 1 [Glycine max]|nr:putative disease resistance RPP13-like protein 1 [Glycine max]
MAAALVGGAFLSAFLDVLFDRLASPEFVDLILGKKLSKKLLQKLETTLRVIRRTPIEEMPRGMSKLNHLQHLDFFAVGKHEENGIKELGGLSNLRGQLEIRNLENVSQSEEALEARMMDKKHINSLRLGWSGCNNNSTNFQLEIDVLCKLQPHFNIESLYIKGYKGTRFPDWMGNSSYCNMTRLYLHDCDNCSMLPSLGQLPSLKDLVISRLNRLKTIDEGFYKNEDCRSGMPFPSLESLVIYEMPCWEVWSSFDSEAFPVLKSLKIRDCPKLEGSLPNHLPALTTLYIINCELLVSSLPTAPAIQSLEIRKSNKVALHAFPLLVETIEVEGSPMVESMIEAITNIQPTCLRSLTLRDCSSAVSFPGGRLPESLKSLSIKDLKKLEFPTQHKHELLETLTIESSCDSLTSLPLVTFPNLRDLAIQNCENMEYLLVSGAESFWREGLPAPNLITFGLKSLPDEMSSLLPKLEYLLISNCPEIESFPKRGMPPNLRKVEIGNCEKLLSGLAWPSMGMLTDLCVGGRCDGIKSFPKEGLLPPSLTYLYLYDMSNLEMLDCTGLLHLTSLQELEIKRCPKLENMAGESLPVSLIKLTINSCPLLEKRCRMKHPQIWPKICHIPGIKRINKLSKATWKLTLYICFEEVTIQVWSSFDSEAFPVLEILEIRDCPKLEGSLPNHLPALKTLTIRNCELLGSSLPTVPAIQSLEICKSNKVALHALPLLVETIEVEGSPMVESMIEAITNIQPTCLRSLTLRDCSSAVSFPGGRLPESLKSLYIEDLKKLEFPTQHKHELLETLSIESSCDSLTSLPLVTFPNLRVVTIGKCENMEYLLVSGAESFKSLCSLSIYQCPNFVSFGREGLPEEMSTLLPKLEYLYISNCPEIESFPEGGMPPNLRTVGIENCEKLLSGLAWPPVTHVYVGGRCDGIKSFPKEGLLPPSLTSLYLIKLINLEMLDCTGLLHLTSLQQLTIQRCPLLENMVGERLPDSLIKLTIENCPLLEKLCRMKHHQIWPKICHIPGIKVDDRWI